MPKRKRQQKDAWIEFLNMLLMSDKARKTFQLYPPDWQQKCNTLAKHQLLQLVSDSVTDSSVVFQLVYSSLPVS